jgi:hypothetical protein
MDIMSSMPDDAKCHQFADYMLENYVSSDARYPLSFGQIFHEKEVNGPEAFHSLDLSLYTYNGAYPTSDHNISQSLMAVTQTPMKHNFHFHIRVWYIIQCIWRQTQTIGFSAKYRDKDSEIGKWLTLFYGLPYLDAEEIEDCFFMDTMSSAQDDAKCHQFADYMSISESLSLYFALNPMVCVLRHIHWPK